MVKLLEIEEDPQVLTHILTHSITRMRQHIRGTQQQLSRLKDAEVRPRRLGEERKHDYEARMLNELDDNEMVNLFGKFEHPLHAMSEYDQFKVTFWQNDQLAATLNPQARNDLRIILETEWVQNKSRVIRKVKQPGE